MKFGVLWWTSERWCGGAIRQFRVQLQRKQERDWDNTGKNANSKLGIPFWKTTTYTPLEVLELFKLLEKFTMEDDVCAWQASIYSPSGLLKGFVFFKKYGFDIGEVTNLKIFISFPLFLILFDVNMFNLLGVKWSFHYFGIPS